MSQPVLPVNGGSTLPAPPPRPQQISSPRQDAGYGPAAAAGMLRAAGYAPRLNPVMGAAPLVHLTHASRGAMHSMPPTVATGLAPLVGLAGLVPQFQPPVFQSMPLGGFTTPASGRGGYLQPHGRAPPRFAST
mmetsp:Transcript_49493/g.125738  ORF Transcript_49493/g.125738 Transcript_49493/m.125738 type:complete len:133 (+) Transcript_49493:161-559(+)